VIAAVKSRTSRPDSDAIHWLSTMLTLIRPTDQYDMEIWRTADGSRDRIGSRLTIGPLRRANFQCAAKVGRQRTSLCKI